MRGFRIALSLAVFFLAVSSGAAHAAPATKKLVSAVLEGRRVASLTCEIINKSGADLGPVDITLKKPDGAPLASPFTCSTIANGETCALTYDIKFPDNDVAAYCHAEVPAGAFVRGALRLENSQSATIAETDLEADIHGKLALLAEKLDLLMSAPSGVVLGVYRENSGNLNGSWLGQNQSLDQDCDTEDIAISGGWEFNDAEGVTVRKSRRDPANPYRWKWQIRRTANTLTGFVQLTTYCLDLDPARP